MQLSRRLRRGLGAALVAVALPLSGCSSNFDSPVLQDYNPTTGVNVREGDVWGLNLLVVMPESGRGTLVGALLNQTSSDDRLVGVTIEAESPETPLEAELLRPDVVLQPDRLVEMSDPPTVLVEGEILQGLFATVTLEFERSAPVEARVPVLGTDGPYADVPLP